MGYSDNDLPISCREFTELMHHHQRAHRLLFALHFSPTTIAKGDLMQGTMPVGFALPFTTSQVDASGNPSKAILSNFVFTSSNNGVFSVGANPADPSTGIAVSVAVGTAQLTGQAQATEADGTSHSISGSATIVVTDVPVPIPPAAALTFTFGAPVPPPPAPPPAPKV